MKFVTVLGARPQFIKASPLSRELRKRHLEVLVHTGQHYDHEMSEIFFSELGIPAPDHHLGIGGGTHGAQTGAMLAGVEEVLLAQVPDAVIVYGDTNSTLAGALAAAKLHIPVAHVEAGLRSYNRLMPEEINRVLADHVSRWLFAPSELSRRQLATEGITEGVHVVGDIMVDAIRLHVEMAGQRSDVVARLGLTAGGYYLATVHRAENTDDAINLEGIFRALNAADRPVLLPLHPRTRKQLRAHEIVPGSNVRVTDPVGYLDMIQLQRSARAVLTDSGGMQKEAYQLGVPCVTLRDESEWVETVDSGWNTLAGCSSELILAALAHLPEAQTPRPPLYGDGHTAERIVGVLEREGARQRRPAPVAGAL